MNNRLTEHYDNLVAIGYILKAKGLHGEIKLKSLSNIAGRFDLLEEVYIELKDSSVIKHTVEYAKLFGEYVIVKLEDINDRAYAESLRGAYVLVDDKNLATLPSESYYIFDLIDMEVFDSDNLCIGKVLCVEQYPANDVIVIRTENNDIMVPAIKEYILDIDTKNKRIMVNIPEGLPEYPNG
ncbi:MAG: 16S rRNA processing protein RimM [Candidatus Latescibacteria bacterium]|nr:16S rRNA processing protein RimM [Candidatus Latescibacterota bacterium]